MKPRCDFASFVSGLMFLHKIFGEHIDGSKYFFTDFFYNFETYSWLKHLFRALQEDLDNRLFEYLARKLEKIRKNLKDLKSL